ncbi:ABC transporter ATP-binding protein [Zhaonella formicivorans]|jgi:simple sugar transport system ATP-binding protein|uniref:ABC transporter ATP-binding protein n=1 Tax=Zhaonella formicivorans TaxID=2528593 RepID=UPI0010E7BAC2|nr:ABC transporter ATP-binding protein [Zhaonella formicivorans]
MPALLELKNICKHFPGVVANDRVNLEISSGEIHALLGENGAGKTTLMNCVYGLYQPEAGEILWKGKPVKINSIKDAINLGIGMVHQHFMLVHNLTVLENVMLGLRKGIFLEKEKVFQDITQLANGYGFKIDLNAQIWQLPVGVQQKVEIIKALYRRAELLILDEPTAVLTPDEVRELFKVLKQLKAEGHSVILITHKLDEVMEISDRATVLRDGKVVATKETCKCDKRSLASMMVGREVFLKLDKKKQQPGKVVLELAHVEALNNKGLKALKDVCLTVRAGEILGIAGVNGNGQTELAEVITGLRPATAGKILVNGKEITNNKPRNIQMLNVAHIPEDRQKVGLILNFSVAENLILGKFYAPPFAKGHILDRNYISQYATKVSGEYDVRTPNLNVEARVLSGGNQQKIILARELERKPELLVAVQPTRGLDIGATEYVHKKMLEQREKGTAILYISTELEEILSLSDRIAVIYEGEIMGILSREEVDLEIIGMMMAGSNKLVSGKGGLV